MAKVIYPSVELALTLGRMVRTVSLLAGLALALSGAGCESPIQLKLSQQAGSQTRGQNPSGRSGAEGGKSAGPVLSPEICIVVDREDNPRPAGESRRRLLSGRQ